MAGPSSKRPEFADLLSIGPRPAEGNDQWEFASQVQAQRVRDALDQLEGLPKPGTIVGGGKHAPDGTTHHLEELEEILLPAARYAVRATRQSKKHAGKNTNVGGQNVSIPEVAAAVARGPEWDPPPP